jgi:Ca-activated chloride channel family protein
MRLLTPLLIVCLFSLGHASVQMQTIRGTVVDPAGTAVPGVSVELHRSDAIERRTVTNTRGEWTFANVAAGDYTVRLALSGFVTTDVLVRVGDTAPAPLRTKLKVGAISDIVEVLDEKTLDKIQRGVGRGVPGGVASGAAGGSPAPLPPPPPPAAGLTSLSSIIVSGVPVDTASYARIEENTFRRVSEHPLSTFSIDVDTASYANVRRFLNMGGLPPADAVRIEELINYFRFDYPEPTRDAPVSVTTEVGSAPWNPKHNLALVGIRSGAVKQEHAPPRNLTFLLDVSGSMAPAARLPLVKTAMQLLVDTLRPEDKVAIVVYASGTGLALATTSGERKAAIKQAIEELRAGGSTNGAGGIQLAYDIASAGFIKGGVNRIILATDGDFNVGMTSRSDLLRLIEEKRERGIFLSVLGVGDDNLKDSTMEMLADKGNGNYSYLDSVQEGRRVLIAEAGATLITVAKDVKIQIEFNPRYVGSYRLVGYENRMLRKEDFNNDRKDAGEIGAGHTVTALYELVPPGEPAPGSDVDRLKYQREPERPAVVSASNELMTVKLRYKKPDGDTSRLLEFPVRNAARRMSANLGFAAAVAEFGMLLRRSPFKGNASWPQTLTLAREHRGRDDDGYRAEFIRLAELAAALENRRTPPEATEKHR